MRNDASVGSPDVLCAESFGSENLRAMERRVGLRPLLAGRPLTERSSTEDPTVRGLDTHLTAVRGLIPKVYGNSKACEQAVSEFSSIVEAGSRGDVIMCKRAALLFALSKEKEVSDFFVNQERKVFGEGPTFTEDLTQRVLPFLMPRFLRNSCQTPDTIVVFSLMLSEMWAGEKLGNFPLAHHDCSVGQLDERNDGESGGSSSGGVDRDYDMVDVGA